MKRILLYIVILAAVLCVPVKGTNVGQLRPVQSVAVYRQDASYIIATDTGDWGQGSTALEALHDLKRTTPAHIYLDTADYLLVSAGARESVESLRKYFKRHVELFSFVGQADMKLVTEFLEIHGEGCPLKEWENGAQLPVLDCREERIKILS